MNRTVDQTLPLPAGLRALGQFVQAGEAFIPSGGAMQSVWVPFPSQFGAASVVVAGAVTGNPDLLQATANGSTAAGFTLSVTRAAGYTTAFTATWIAVGS